MHLQLEKLYTYPIKSCKGIALTNTSIEAIGFAFDRSFAIINAQQKILTARENQKLLTIQPHIQNNALTLSTPKQSNISIDISYIPANTIEVGIFSDVASANIVGSETDDWLSHVLEEKCRLVSIDTTRLRKMKPKYNGLETDFISFSDIAPIHLISEASLADLNAKLDHSVTINRFRPNIVVSGCKAYEEDRWTHITIGNCEFEVTLKTPRCTFTTIDPLTTTVDSKQEPLRTMASYRKTNSTVDFGIYLKPTKMGRINNNDSIEAR